MTGNDPGDADTGANDLQNFPVVVAAPGGVQATLNSAPNASYVLEFFANTACDPSGNGEGQFFLTTTTVTTDDGGNVTVPFIASPNGFFITGTATNSNGSTSEFSQCVAPAAADADLSITKTDSADPVVAHTPFTYTLTVHNGGPNPATSVIVGDTLPEGVTVSATAMEPPGVCDTSIPGQVTCVLTNPLASGANATIFLTATAATAGLITNEAIVVSAQTDPNFLNNFATEQTMVLAQASCAAPTVSGPTLYASGVPVFTPTAGDVNHDGADDLILTGFPGPNVILLRSNGAGGFLAPVFVPIDTLTGPGSVAIVDVTTTGTSIWSSAMLLRAL